MVPCVAAAPRPAGMSSSASRASLMGPPPFAVGLQACGVPKGAAPFLGAAHHHHLAYADHPTAERTAASGDAPSLGERGEGQVLLEKGPLEERKSAGKVSLQETTLLACVSYWLQPSLGTSAPNSCRKYGKRELFVRFRGLHNELGQKINFDCFPRCGAVQLLRHHFEPLLRDPPSACGTASGEKKTWFHFQSNL